MDEIRGLFERYNQFMARMELAATVGRLPAMARRMTWSEFQRAFADDSPMPAAVRERWRRRLAEGGFERERAEVAATVSSIMELLSGDAKSDDEAA